MTPAHPPPGHSATVSEGWALAGWKAILVLALAFVGFAVVPNRLIAFLSTRVAPRARDALVTLWVAVFFMVLTWLFVRLQRRWKA